MNLDIKTLNGEIKSTLTVSENIFSKSYNEPLIHQVVVSYLSSSRQGTKAQKNRSEVSGGGAKPWKQKGTGRARAGTIRSPIFRTGGVTFAAKNRDFSKKTNKKMYRAAMCSIFSELLRKNNLILIDTIKVDKPKTKEFSVILDKMTNLGVTGKILIVVEKNEFTEHLYLASRNIKNVIVSDTQGVNPFLLLSCSKIVVTSAAIKKIEGGFL